MRDNLKIKDMQGNVVAEIQEKIARVKDTMDIARNGQKIATVKKALVTPLRGRFRSTWWVVRTWTSMGISSVMNSR